MKALWYWLDLWARSIIPVGLSVVFVLLSVVPLPFSGSGSVVPMLAMASVFFWAVHHPALLPPAAVFAIGLLQDILTGALLGSGAVILLLVYCIVASQRVIFYNKSFLVVWCGFAVVAPVAGLLDWALSSAFSGHLHAPGAMVLQVLLSVALYPLFTRILHGVHRLLPVKA